VRTHPESISVLSVGLAVRELPGAVVVEADDVLGALARLSDGGFDVVLLSLDLPDEAGPDAIRSVRERAPEVPVVGVAEEDGQVQAALAAGAYDVVPSDAGLELITRALRYAVVLQRTQAELRRREFIDEATGLYNERGFEEFAAHHLSLAARSKQPIVLLSVRLGGSEDLGEPEVDPALVPGFAETADVLRAAVRDCDIVARRGDGSFILLLTGDASGAEALVLSRLVDAVAVRNAREGARGGLSLSIGAATFDPAHPVALPDLLAAAERGGESGGRP
jgi:diguanylate cyclase (GGDEF)-like protein